MDVASEPIPKRGEKRRRYSDDWRRSDGSKLSQSPPPNQPSQIEAVLEAANKMRKESLTDETTKTFSKKYLERFITFLQQNKLENNQNHTHDIGIIFVDLDDLKTINDTENHEAGDRLLMEASNLLRQIAPIDIETYLDGKIKTADGRAVINARTEVRENFLVRRSGDEFVIVCFNQDNKPDFLAELEQRMQDLQQQAEKKGVKFSYGADVCRKDQLADNIKNTINEADRRMLRQKEQRKGKWHKLAKAIFTLMTGRSR